MTYPDECGQYKSANNYLIFKWNDNGRGMTFARNGRAETELADDEFKVWMKSSTSKIDPSFKRRVIKLVQHPKCLEKYGAKDKVIVEYTGKRTRKMKEMKIALRVSLTTFNSFWFWFIFVLHIVSAFGFVKKRNTLHG